jgi:hypothetical protein
LKENWKTKEATETDGANTVDPTVTSASRDLHLRETGLSKKSLTKALELIRLECEQDVEELSTPLGTIILIWWRRPIFRFWQLALHGPPGVPATNHTFDVSGIDSPRFLPCRGQ